MTRFIPLVDKNTKVVYEWTKVAEDGSEERVTLFREQWKRESDWTVEQLNALFKTEVAIEESNTEVEEPEMFEEEALEDTPVFIRDFSTPGEE